MELAFVDVQGFKIKANQFVVKEICIVAGNVLFHDIITSPCKYEELSTVDQTNCKWLEKNYHGIKWMDGNTTQKKLQKRIESILSETIVLVKGLEKIKWIKEICGNTKLICLNIEDMDCNLKFSKPICNDNIDNVDCTHHKGIRNTNQCHCALKNVNSMKSWFLTSKFCNYVN